MDTRYSVVCVCVCVCVCRNTQILYSDKGLSDQLDVMSHANSTQLSLDHPYVCTCTWTWHMGSTHVPQILTSLLMLQPQQLTKPWMASNQVTGCVPTISREGSLSINTTNTKNPSMGSSIPQGSKHVYRTTQQG